MNTTEKIIVGIVVFLGAGLLIFSIVGLMDTLNIGDQATSTSQRELTPPPTVSSTILPANSLTRTSEGEVSVELVPKEYKEGKFIVSIGINTHTVNNLVQYNLKEIITLTTDGKSYNPVTTPTLSGHHNSGELAFELPQEPTQFQITIVGLDAVPTRNFNWP